MEEQFDFWKWFALHENDYKNLDELSEIERDRRLNSLLDELHRYDENLYFQIGFDSNSERNELIITAEGNREYFDKVITLVEHAPKVKNWDIIAFKEAQRLDFEIDYEGLRLFPKDMWFLPLDNENIPGILGLRIYLPNYISADEKKCTAALYQILDTLLGEMSLANNIAHIEIDRLPDEPEQHGLINLHELPNYIKWLKTNRG